MPSYVLLAGLLDPFLPDFFLFDRISVTNNGVSFDHDFSGGVLECGSLDHASDAIRSHLHLHIGLFLLIQLLLRLQFDPGP